MMDIDAARVHVYTKFTDEWGDRSAFTFDGEPFDPSDVNQVAEGEPWVRVSVRHLDRYQSTLGASGNRKFITVANVYIEIRYPLNKGMKPVDDLTKPAIAIFECARYQGLIFGASVPNESRPESVYQPVVVSTRFEYEGIK